MLTFIQKSKHGAKSKKEEDFDLDADFDTDKVAQNIGRLKI